MSATTTSLSSLVVLCDVDWETYEKVRDVDGNRNLRMTYDQGTLSIMSPSKLHERVAELLAQMIVAWTDASGVARQSCGSTTLKKVSSRRGIEPDKCFYFENEAAVRQRDEHDPSIDPPADLGIEVDVSASSDARLPIPRSRADQD
jgi:Uma2 family endonuclease